MNNPPSVSRSLLSYDEALARVLDTVSGPLESELVALADGAGRAVAANIYAAEDLPPFDNSAVDGYAIDGSQPGGLRREWRISHEIAAGSDSPGRISGNWTARIFTGAPMPEGADHVVMQEDAEPGDFDEVFLHETGSPGDHVRRRGSDVARGALAVPSGTALDAGVAGLLASLNVAEIACPRRPLVGVVTTGDEVVPLGPSPLKPGQIRNSNAPSLRAAVEEAGGVVLVTRHAADTPAAVRQALADCAGCDMIITCGGVSVGAHDHVKAAVEETGTLDFWRIAIKPGKPLAFGKIGNALYFGLPGNPVSSLVTFELFARPVLRKLQGHRELTRRTVSAILDEPMPHERGRREFVRARLTWKNDTFHATITGPQGSHRLHSLLGADAYIIASEDRGDYATGERLPAMLLG